MATPLSLAYRAEILRPNEPGDAARIRMLASRPGYETVDTLRAQIADLIDARRVTHEQRISSSEDAVAGFQREQGPDYGAWAHYPWARRIVRVLPEPDFVWLRTNRNQHKITASEQCRLAGKKIGIVGLSVGQSVALTLALERSCGELRLADFDAIDLSNLNRLRCGIHSIGLPKTVVAAREISELDPYLNVVCFSDGFTRENSDEFLEGLDVVVDECDSLDVKLRMRSAARARGIPVLMNTSDRGMTDIERFDLEPERALFHGRVAASPEALEGLSNEDKIPVVLDIIGVTTASPRLRASMLEIEQSIKTWPQLAADVTLGGAIVCDVARRLLLGEAVASGRYYMDLSRIGSTDPNSDAEDAEIPTVAHPSRADEAKDDGVDEAFRGIVADAALAPSAGNVQPWKWKGAHDGLTLQHRHGDQTSVLYHDDKAAMVGLGATFESALISAKHRGYRADIVLNLEAGGSAVLLLSEGDAIGTEPLYPQLSRRRSVRTRPSVAESLPQTPLDATRAQIEAFPGMNMSYLTQRDGIESVARLVGEGERLRMLDPESHADMVHEIAWSEPRHQRDGEGIPLAALSLSAGEEAGLQVVRDPAVAAMLREWGLGEGLSKSSRELVASSSAVGLLWCASNERRDYFSGGRALQRLWLEATRADIGLCPVTALCYMLAAWRAGRTLTREQAAALPDIDRRFRALFGVPEHRGDIALFRLVPAAESLNQPRVTFRRAMACR